MKADWIAFVLLFAVQFLGCYCSNGICTSNVIKLVYTTKYKSKLVYYSQHYRYNCGIFGWDWEKCSSYRTRSYYTSSSYSASVYKLSQMQYCCSGYSGSASNGYCSPICNNPSCVYGACIAPNTCSCFEGWNGTACDKAICTEECVHGACTAPDTCSCEDGWTGDTCDTDIEECQMNNGGCDHVCIESIGSYHCQCKDGYRLNDDDLHSCEDIDECDEGVVIIADTLEEALQVQYNNTNQISSGDDDTPLQWCQQLCVNTNGSYNCDCKEGYYLDMVDNSTCLDINECEDSNGRCDHICHNTNGSYYCTCRKGFLLLEDGKGCTDHDECNSTIFNHNCSQECHNTHGGYRCSCFDGFRLDQEDLKYCHDVDECSDGLDECSDICHNTIGSYYCTCNHGYEMKADNVTCRDIDECTVNSNNGGCDHVCNNLPGTYQCECKPGYLLSHDKHSCYGEPCDSFLVKPVNGSIHCTGPQVTGESCHFTCDPGYYLTGSSIRDCLYNHTWSSTDPSCEPLQCAELAPPTNALVVSPCDHSFTSECTIICNHGYHVSGQPSDEHYWVQTCVLDESQTMVEWSQTQLCSKSDPCDNNPCNQGTCSVTMSGQVSCDCEGSLTLGDRCDTSYIYIDSIPPLTANVSHQVTVTSSLSDERQLAIDIQGPQRLMTDPQTVPLTVATIKSISTDSFTLKATQPGIYGIRYQVNPSDNVINPDDSIVLIKGSQQAGGQTGNDYFSQYGLEEGILREGCCRLSLPDTSRVCMSEIVLSSLCEWASAEGGLRTTKGIVFIGNRAITLPLSISGISIGNTDPPSVDLSIPFNSITTNCTKCANPHNSSKQKCLSTNTGMASINYDTHDTEMFLSKKSLLKTVLSILSPILPTWLSINVWPTSDTPSYSLYDYTSAIVTGKEIQSIPYCSIINPSHNTLYYVLRTKVPLHVKIDSYNTFLYSLQLNPQCIVIDMCTRATPTVHLHVPTDLQPSQLTNLRYFQQLVSNDGKMSINTISVSKNGFQGLQAQSEPSYWAGSSFITPSVNTYEFQAQVKLNKLFKGRDLEVHMVFDGLAYHTSTQEDKNKVPGLLQGDITLRVSTVINGTRTHQLVFYGQEAIFSYPTGSSDVSAAILTSGISFKLTYNGFYFLPFSEVSTAGNDCPVNGFLSLNNDLHINNFTIASDCLELRLGQVILPANAFTRVLVFNGVHSGSSLAIFSKLSIPKFSIGNILHLVQQDSSRNGIELYYTSDYEPTLLTGMIHNVNVSVFDGHLTTNISISGLSVTFEGLTPLFSHYDVNVSGSASLDNVDLELLTDFVFVDQVNRFKADLTNYLKSHIEDEHSSLMEGKLKMDLVSNTSEIILNHLASAIEALEGETNTMTDRLNELNKTINSLSIKVKHLRDTLIFLLLSHGETLACLTNSECPLLPVDTVNCEMCHKVIQVSSRQVCNRFVEKERVVTKYRIVESQGQRYETRCRPCWEVLWYVLPFYSETSCCHTKSHPYMYNTSVPYHVTEYYMEEEQYTCTGYVNEEKNELCCNNAVEQSSNTSCITDEFVCAENKYLNSPSVPYTVRQDYINYLNVKVNLTLVELEHSLLAKRIAHAMEEHRVMSAIVNSLMSSQAIRNKLKSETQQDIETFSKLFDQGNDKMKSIEVLEISFTYTLTNHTPLSVPVQVKLNYDNEITEAVLSLDFVNPLDIVYRQLSGQILQHILTIEQDRSKRQAEMPMMTDDVEESYLSAECNKLDDMEGFVLRIIDSLNSSISAFERNMKLLQNGHHIDSNLEDNGISVSNYTSGIIQSIADYGQFRNYSLTRFQELVTNYAYIQWQLDFDIQYNSTTANDGVSCICLADCLQSVLFNLIYAIQDTPVNGAQDVLVKANSIKDDILVMSVYNSSYTFTQANHTLYSLLDIFNELKSLEFWCSAAPVFLNQPQPVINIESGQILEITCDVYSSTMSVHYIWKRDSIVLSQSLRVLFVPDIDMTDAGKYQCIATNSAGSVESLKSVVNVLVKPVLSVGLNLVYEVVETYNSGVRLSCEADGSPTPKWRWMFQRSLEDVPTEMIGESSNSIVIDSPTQASNEGWYTCIAYNTVGNVSSDSSYLLVLPSTLSSMQYSIDLQFTSNTTPIQDGDNNPNLTQALTRELEKVIQSKAIVTELYLTKTSVDNVYQMFFTLSTPLYTGLQLNSMEQAIDTVSPDIDNLEQSKTLLTTQDNIVLTIQGVGGAGISFTSVVDSVTIQPRHVSCPEGFEVSPNFMICVGCKPGHYGNSDDSGRLTHVIDTGNGGYITQTHDQCSLCPIGYYQSYKSQRECVRCRENTSTDGFGTTSSQECLALCQPHTISNTGLHPCIPCPYNHYQPEYGGTKCHECSPTTSSDVDVCHSHSNVSTTTIQPIPTPSNRMSTSTNVAASNDPSVATAAVGSDSGLVMTISATASAVVIVLIVILVCMVVIIMVINRRSKHQSAIARSMGINPNLRGSLELNSYEDSKPDEYYNTPKKSEILEPGCDKLGELPVPFYSEGVNSNDPIYEPLNPDTAITTTNAPLPPVLSIEIPDLPPRGVLRIPHIVNDYSEVGSLRSENEYMPMDSGGCINTDNTDYEEINKSET